MDFSKELEQILAYEEDALSLFQKKTYDSAYKKFQDVVHDFMIKFDTLEYGEYSSLVRTFIDAFYADLCKYTGFRVFQKSEALRKHNMYMVSYILPFFMEHNESSKEFAQQLVASWPDTFKNSHIQAATFEEIKAGFVTRLFGMVIQN